MRWRGSCMNRARPPGTPAIKLSDMAKKKAAKKKVAKKKTATSAEKAKVKSPKKKAPKKKVAKKKVTKKKAAAKKPKAKPEKKSKGRPSDEQIRAEAFLVYEERAGKGEPGGPEDDWHEALRRLGVE